MKHKLPTPRVFKRNIGKAVSYKELANWYGGSDWIELQCAYYKKENRQYLSGVISFWSKSGNREKNPGEKSSCHTDMPIYIRAV